MKYSTAFSISLLVTILGVAVKILMVVKYPGNEGELVLTALYLAGSSLAAGFLCWIHKDKS